MEVLRLLCLTTKKTPIPIVAVLHLRQFQRAYTAASAQPLRSKKRKSQTKVFHDRFYFLFIYLKIVLPTSANYCCRQKTSLILGLFERSEVAEETVVSHSCIFFATKMRDLMAAMVVTVDM